MEKVTITKLQQMKNERKKITMLTAYDFPTACILDQCGIDILLIGDSVGNTILGYSNTLPVTMEEMIHHTKAVTRGRKRALVVADMPFMSYQVSLEEAKRNAGRLIKEGEAEAVKVEGGENVEPIIKAITEIDIPVMGHIGLTPQSIHRIGGYHLQGKDEKQREKIIADALAVERAGAFAIVLEVIPASLAQDITNLLKIPTIGIGAGIHCDGQVLVINDLLGIVSGFRPKFVKRYANLKEIISQAVKEFITEVREGKFPDENHSFM